MTFNPEYEKGEYSSTRELFKDLFIDDPHALPEEIFLKEILFWFVILVAYVLFRRPAMYDGFRHFLFILPPVFIFIGVAFQFLHENIFVLCGCLSKLFHYFQ